LLRRTLIAIPFAIAFVLNMLAVIARPLGWRSRHIEGYTFLFATPWAWLLDRDWLVVHNKIAEEILTFAILLWVPAVLCSLCFWLFLRTFRLKG